MTTTATFLSNLVGNAFDSTPQSEALTTAEAYFQTASSTNENEQLATAMLAAAILEARRKLELGKTNPEIDSTVSLSRLVTQEMLDLLTKDDSASQYSSIIVNQRLSTSRHWSRPYG